MGGQRKSPPQGAGGWMGCTVSQPALCCRSHRPPCVRLRRLQRSPPLRSIDLLCASTRTAPAMLHDIGRTPVQYVEAYTPTQ